MEENAKINMVRTKTLGKGIQTHALMADKWRVYPLREDGCAVPFRVYETRHLIGFFVFARKGVSLC